MKTNLKQKIIIFISLTIVTVFLFATLKLALIPAFASADTVEGNGYENSIVENNSLEDLEKTSKEIKSAEADENCLDEIVQMQESIISIEESFAEKNTNVSSELEKQIKKYEELITDETSEEERVKIQDLISITQQLNEEYHLGTVSSQNIFMPNYYAANEASDIVADAVADSVYGTYVTAMIAAFSVAGFDLMAELTSIALKTDKYTNDSGNIYYPVYGKRVMASRYTYDIATGNLNSGEVNPNSNEDLAGFTDVGFFNTYEQDLHYALRRCTFKKVGKVVTFEDTYDYHADDGKLEQDMQGDLQEFSYKRMYEAQQRGVIHEVKVNIIFDTSEYLRSEIVGKQGNTWNIRVSNYKNKPVDVLYNSKMCFKDDAINWTNLSDNKVVRIPANGSTIVNVTENYMATDFAFCYMDEGTRKITYAHHAYLYKEDYKLNPDITTSTVPFYNNMGIVAKNGSTWLINVKNNYSVGRTLEYNSRMCFEDDAKNWNGLVHQKSIYLSNGENRIISISEYGSAGHIAISFKNNDQREIYYADQLKKDECTMNVKSNILYTFLNLSIAKKSGSTWYINIYNPTSNSLSVAYNSKMCTRSNAANWSGLKSISYITIPAGQSKQVEIKEIGLTTSITVSYVKNGKRVITYADGLKKNGSINVMYKQI